MRGSQAAVPLVELTAGTSVAGRNLSARGEVGCCEYAVMIETSGERFIGELPPEVIKIVDVKCPDSGEPDTFEMRNLEALSETMK